MDLSSVAVDRNGRRRMSREVTAGILIEVTAELASASFSTGFPVVRNRNRQRSP